MQMNTRISYQTKKSLINSNSRNLILPKVQLHKVIVSKSNSFNSEFELKPMSSYQAELRLNFTNNSDISELSIFKSKQLLFRSLTAYPVLSAVLWMFCWCYLLILIIYEHEDKNNSHR